MCFPKPVPAAHAPGLCRGHPCAAGGSARSQQARRCGQRLVAEVRLMPDGDICPVTRPGCQLNIDNSEVVFVREVPAGIPVSPLRVLAA